MTSIIKVITPYYVTEVEVDDVVYSDNNAVWLLKGKIVLMVNSLEFVVEYL